MKHRSLPQFIFTILVSVMLFSIGTSFAASPAPETAAPTIAADETPEPQTKKTPAFLVNWLHMLDRSTANDAESSGVIAYGPQVPRDLSKTLASTGGENGGFGFFWVLFRSIIAICIGTLGVYITKRLFRDKVTKLETIEAPNDDPISLLWVNVLRNIPAFASIIFLTILSIILFLLIAGGVTAGGRMFFQAILGTIVIYTSCLTLSRVIFSPKDGSIRLFKIRDNLVKSLHKAVVLSSTILLSCLLIVRLIKELGAQPQTVSWVIMILGTIVITLYAFIAIKLKGTISGIIESQEQKNDSHWIQNQIINYWHVPVLLYLFFVWFIWIGQELTGDKARNGAFIISMLILPIYLVLSHAGKIIITSIVDSLGLGNKAEQDPITQEIIEIDETEIIERKKRIVTQSHLFYRIILIFSLGSWLLSLWGYQLPFAEHTVKAIFQSLVAIALALSCWHLVSGYIQKKIKDTTPEQEDETQNDDDEFGGAAPRGRAHTLLPMLRKVVGTVLIVMVILIVISSLGINIGPLLAGAGVVGLAVGFGAQKLVSDILSGFFFLLDDAFRVGEYIQAGKIRGTVEAITLRNVMLRHHLGMLQVVPHSDLGAITNYMRGGIVIKFPLEFPYDADIDKIRKIIKKVGIAMLKDEELGEDFLQPIKSQGVYEITNSIMVIRVKFTAKPGKQFVIKREAFRRITEALNAKDIYYAHRKVIVDFPEDQQKNSIDEQTQQRTLQAGAAAEATIQAEEQAKLKQQQDTK